MPEGLVEACFDSFIKKYFRLIDTSKMEPCSDFFTQNVAHTLLNFGMEVIKPTMNRKQKILTDKARNLIINTKHYIPKGRAMFIDSGGFQILGGYVPLNYMNYLADMYTDFIVDTKDESDMYYFYLDVNVIQGISPDFSKSSMLYFQNKLEEKTKDNDQKSKIYAVYHCNTPIAYKTFIKYFEENYISERLGSHRYAVGGMVPLNFNSEKLQIKPYMYPLFECIEKERNYLNSGGHVYYHILGVSGVFEEFLVLWCMSYFKMIGWNLHITFDSSTALYKATRSLTLFHINEDKVITSIGARYSDLHHKPDSKQQNLHLNEWYILDILHKVRDQIIPKPKFHLDTIEDCFETVNGKVRWSPSFAYSSVLYEFWAFAEMYRIFEASVYSNPEIITDMTGQTRFEHLMSHINQFMYIKNMRSFNRRTYRSLNTSFEYLRSFVEKKVTLNTIRNMCIQDVSENTGRLAYNHDVIL